MAFTPFENSVMVDDRTVSFDKVPQAGDKVNVVNRIKKAWDGLASDLEGLGGIKLKKPDIDALADTLIKSGTHAVIFELVLTRAEFRLDIVIGNTTLKSGTGRVPTDLEEYRNFLSSLNGWSNGDRNIVPDSDFKKFNDANPKKPAKPTYKDFDEMAKKSKSDTDTFRTWAKTNSAGKKALEAIDKTAKAKPADPARVAALKAINACYQEWLKTF